jgi:hypothetical protein
MRLVSQVNHPNIVHAYDAGPIGGWHMIVMEYVEGADLARLVKQRGPLPPALACDYVRQAALGMQHAHERGLVHRDIQPSNLLVCGEKVPGRSSTHHSPLTTHQIKIHDLGLGRLRPHADGESSKTQITMHGSDALGVSEYTAPEQALDFHKADIRADIYSLGATLFCLLTGRPPFPIQTVADKLFWLQQTAAPPVEQFRPDLPPGLGAVVGRMLAREPQDRYQTPAEVAQALAPFADKHCDAGPEVVAQASSLGYGGQARTLTPRGPGTRLVSALRGRGRWILFLLGLLLAVGVGGWTISLFLSDPKPAPEAPIPPDRAPERPMRNARLRELGDNTWVRIGPFRGRDKSSHEVPWCYDPDRRRFVRLGGRQTVHSNEIWTFDLGTLKWSLVLPHAFDPAHPNRGLATRPGYGSQRGTCYDRDNKCIWDYCNSQVPGGTHGLWKGVADLGADKWLVAVEVPGFSWPRLAYDEHARKVVSLAHDSGTFGRTYLYDPPTGKVFEGAADPNGELTGRLGMSMFPGFIYVPELKGCLFVAQAAGKFKKPGGPQMVTWLFDATSKKWRDLAPPGPTPSIRLGMGLSCDRKNGVVVLFGGISVGPTPEILDDTWIYDPVRNTWTEMKPATGPKHHYYPNRPTGPADCQMLAYDEEHNVHVLVLQRWAGDDAVWAYRYKK